MALDDVARPLGAERAGDQTVWRDADAALAAACAELQSGELLHGESFSLFEAMAALQMMDPKMDAGMGGGKGEGGGEGQAGARGEVESVGEAVERGLLPLPLPAHRIVDLCDALLCAEATWHSGHSLPQTVFTCAYLLLPPLAPPSACTPSPSPSLSLASSPLLLALLSAVLACVNSVRSASCWTHQREEEDFVTSAGGLPLEGRVGEAAVAPLRALLAGLEGQGAGKASASGRKEQQQRDPVLSGLPPALLTALVARMQFRLALFDALSALQTARLPAHLPACALKIQLAQTALHKLKTSMPPPAPPAGGEEGEGEHADEVGSLGQQTASWRAAPGICPAINTHLLPPTPPRPTHLLTWHEALDHFSSLLTHLTFICHLPSTSPPDLLELSRFLAHFRALNPGPVARAALQLLLLRDGLILGHDPTDVILHSLHLPPALLPPAGAAADSGGDAGVSGGGGGDAGSSAALGKFVKKASHAVQAVLRAQCSNRARERRMLAKLLPDWSHLLTLAGDVDACDAVERYTAANFAQGWWRESVATSWVVEHTCRIVIRYLLLGFSTRLYAPSEFLSAFWYLDSVLATLIHNVSAREASLQKPFTAPSSRKGRRKPAAVPPPSPPPPSLDLALITAYQLLCKAYVRLLAAFVEDGKLPQRPSPFNSDRQRYQQRYAVLKRVQLPEPLSYAAFQRAVSPAGLSVPELYQMSLDFFRTTATNLPTIHALAATAAPGGTAGASEAVEGEVQQLERVCASNATALCVAHRAGAGSVLKASFEFTAHPFFPVVTLKRA
ncbi:unnamed protein product [Closterium sp. Naga37s-1]|nr:unnamed protein product [Closterium sp. Naga37s-1]